jgi:hypothetical protein
MAEPAPIKPTVRAPARSTRGRLRPRTPLRAPGTPDRPVSPPVLATAMRGRKSRHQRVAKSAPEAEPLSVPTGERVPAICNACGLRQSMPAPVVAQARPANAAPKPGEPAPWGRASNEALPMTPPCNGCGNRTLRVA